MMIIGLLVILWVLSIYSYLYCKYIVGFGNIIKLNCFGDTEGLFFAAFVCGWFMFGFFIYLFIKGYNYRHPSDKN